MQKKIWNVSRLNIKLDASSAQLELLKSKLFENKLNLKD